MANTSITTESDHIVYLDFDGTLTGLDGKQAIGLDLCQGLANADTPEKRAQFREQYISSDEAVKIKADAKDFLNQINAHYPQLKIVIISRNYENYIRALLEFENIDTKNITIYPRGMGRELGLGEDKRAAVTHHEQHCTPGVRLIADDNEGDYFEMHKGTERVGNEVIGEHKPDGKFSWDALLKQVFQKILHIVPVPEYLNGRTSNRFHLFPVQTNSSEEPATFKEQYGGLKSDDLKRAILNNLKMNIKDIDNVDDLKQFKKEFKSSYEYQVLAKGQGLTTRILNLVTDSQHAVESIFKHQEESISKSTLKHNK